jgi:streptogramin lyase
MARRSGNPRSRIGVVFSLRRALVPLLLGIFAGALTVVLPIAGEARAAAVTEYPIPTADAEPGGLLSGPDGALWFTESAGDKIGRLTPSGLVTEYSLPTPNADPSGITLGSDGALWFTEEGGAQVGRISTSGTVQEYPVSASGGTSTSIAAGPDNALWFTEPGGSIGHITTSGTLTQLGLPPDVAAQAITAGPDGAMWFSEANGNYIGRITISGTVTQFPLPALPSPNDYRALPDITTGPDGALWFTDVVSCEFLCGHYGFLDGYVGRITTSGAITLYPTPGLPQAITAGPDGAMWFSDLDGGPQTTGDVAEISTSGGDLTQYTPNGNAVSITAGPDGATWFTDNSDNEIGRIDVPASSPPSSPTVTLSNVRASVSGSTVTITANTSSAVKNVVLLLNLSGYAKAAPDQTPSNGTVTFTVPNLPAGSYSWYLQGWNVPSGQPGGTASQVVPVSFAIAAPSTPSPSPSPAPTPPTKVTTPAPVVGPPTVAKTTPKSASTHKRAIAAYVHARFKPSTDTKVLTLDVENVPAGATVKVTCSGTGCPYAMRMFVAKHVETINLEPGFRDHRLHTGDRITVTISEGGLDKQYSYTTRAHEAPRVQKRLATHSA